MSAIFMSSVSKIPKFWIELLGHKYWMGLGKSTLWIWLGVLASNPAELVGESIMKTEAHHYLDLQNSHLATHLANLDSSEYEEVCHDSELVNLFIHEEIRKRKEDRVFTPDFLDYSRLSLAAWCVKRMHYLSGKFPHTKDDRFNFNLNLRDVARENLFLKADNYYLKIKVEAFEENYSTLKQENFKLRAKLNKLKEDESASS